MLKSKAGIKPPYYFYPPHYETLEEAEKTLQALNNDERLRDVVWIPKHVQFEIVPAVNQFEDNAKLVNKHYTYDKVPKNSIIGKFAYKYGLTRDAWRSVPHDPPIVASRRHFISGPLGEIYHPWRTKGLRFRLKSGEDHKFDINDDAQCKSVIETIGLGKGQQTQTQGKG